MEDPTKPEFRSMPDRFQRDAVMVSVFFLGIILIETASILILNHGRFSYTMDDPYIHLAVAEQLAQSGHYGVNASEVSAPCSSPLWPFLMVPFALLPGFAIVPLIINIIAGFLTAIMALGRVRKWIPARPDDRAGATLRAAVVCSFLLATNIIGVVFTGMEHSFQVLLAIVVVEGMLRLAEGTQPGRWFPLALAVGPLIRYENLALTLPALMLSFALGHRRMAVITGIAALTGLAAFSFYLMSLGLAPVPASITAKSTFIGEPPVVSLLKNLKNSLSGGRGMLVALATSLLAGIALAWRGGMAWRATSVCLASAGFLHLIAGAYGWVNRYEIYILAALIWGLAGIAYHALDTEGSLPSRHLGWLLLPLVPTVGFPYLTGLLVLPLASNNIYEQHYQMHRFALDFWKKPVAVNDLGWVAFRNPQYVLDLWGLASPVALQSRMDQADPEWMVTLGDEHGVQLAMVYDEWFPAKPAAWREVGALRLSRKSITPAGNAVTFYATTPESVPAIRECLRRFEHSLPRPGMLEIRN